jgi:hypothetical protein
MPCPTCNHTMHNLGISEGGGRIFWCPRCGTLKSENLSGFEGSDAPMLVGRVRKILCVKAQMVFTRDLTRALEECVQLPADRSTT